MEAAADGRGLATLPTFIAADAIRRGCLVPVLVRRRTFLMLGGRHIAALVVDFPSSPRPPGRALRPRISGPALDTVVKIALAIMPTR